MDTKHARLKDEGRAFISWYNDRHGTDFEFVKTGESPNLYFMGAHRNLGVEIAPVAPLRSGRGVVMDACRFVVDIESTIKQKSRERYGHACMLLVDVIQPLFTAGGTESLCSSVRIPERHPFEAIFVGARFPGSLTGAKKTYRWWRLA